MDPGYLYESIPTSGPARPPATEGHTCDEADPVEPVRRAFQKIAADRSLLTRAREATVLIDQLNCVINALSMTRKNAIRTLVDGGMGLQELGTQVGLSRSRVHQIFNDPEGSKGAALDEGQEQ